jgi:hypothetical protein
MFDPYPVNSTNITRPLWSWENPPTHLPGSEFVPAPEVGDLAAAHLLHESVVGFPTLQPGNVGFCGDKESLLAIIKKNFETSLVHHLTYIYIQYTLYTTYYIDNTEYVMHNWKTVIIMLIFI